MDTEKLVRNPSIASIFTATGDAVKTTLHDGAAHSKTDTSSILC